MKKTLRRRIFALVLCLMFALCLSACTDEAGTLAGGKETENLISAQGKQAAQDGTDADLSVQDGTDADTSNTQGEDVPAQPKGDDTVQETVPAGEANNDRITKEQAKKIALDDAGVAAADVYDFEIELDNEKSVLCYDISFEYNNRDYDYDIDAKTGEIISADKPNAASDEAEISKDKAKSIALEHAGVKAADIYAYEIELEKENGVWKYDISFKKGNVEYDYTVNAQTGKIIKSEKETDD